MVNSGMSDQTARFVTSKPVVKTVRAVAKGGGCRTKSNYRSSSKDDIPCKNCFFYRRRLAENFSEWYVYIPMILILLTLVAFLIKYALVQYYKESAKLND